MNVKTRISVENQIAKKVVKDLLAEGLNLHVISEGDRLLTSKDEKEILSLVLDLEEVSLQTVDGYVLLVFGNDGYDLIVDYSLSLEETLAEALKVSRRLEEKFG